jgi:hypothetical protein
MITYIEAAGKHLRAVACTPSKTQVSSGDASDAEYAHFDKNGKYL